MSDERIRASLPTMRAANRKAVEVLLEHGAVEPGDRIIITKGDLMGVHGGTNSLKIVEVGN